MKEQEKTRLEEAIRDGIEKYVNGNIRALRKDMEEANKIQNEKIEAMANDVKSLMEVFHDTSGFFKIVVKIVQFLLLIGAFVGMVLGVTRWLKN